MKILENKNLFDDYEEVFNQWLDEQIIEEVDPCDLDRTDCHFLPHRTLHDKNSPGL